MLEKYFISENENLVFEFMVAKILSYKK